MDRRDMPGLTHYRYPGVLALPEARGCGGQLKEAQEFVDYDDTPSCAACIRVVLSYYHFPPRAVVTWPEYIHAYATLTRGSEL